MFRFFTDRPHEGDIRVVEKLSVIQPKDIPVPKAVKSPFGLAITALFKVGAHMRAGRFKNFVIAVDKKDHDFLPALKTAGVHTLDIKPVEGKNTENIRWIGFGFWRRHVISFYPQGSVWVGFIPIRENKA